VPIGETLAEARRQAGLTVTQVSERTRIRETIIMGVEDDDYSSCGGDFYARGNIRAIAKVIGTDSEPLIREYDAVHRAPGALSTVSRDELLATSVKAAQRRRPDLSTVWEPVAAYRSVRQRVNLPAVRGLVAAAYRSVRQRVNLPAVRDLVAAAYPAVRRRPRSTAVLGLALVVVLGFGVDRFLSGSQHAAVAPPAAGNHAVTHRHAGPSGPNPAPTTSQKAVAPSPAPAVPALTLTPVSAKAFGPGGGPGDNPQLARLAIDGNRATGWHTDRYTSARFGNLYPGTGLLLDMGRTVTITSVRINLGRVSGAGFQLRAGARPSLTDLPPVARASDAGGVVRLRLTTPTHGRYVLLWFTRLPADPAGTFQAGVYNIRLAGHP
jgi:helix-turn-helix protein